MKRTFHTRRSLCLMLSAVCFFGTALTARAEDYKGKSGYEVSFDGNHLSSNFTESDLASGVSGLEPGDTVTFTITVRNDASAGNDWYMNNEVLESMEDHSLAKGGAYTYRLTFERNGSVTEIYDSTRVGGVSYGGYSSNGLHEATEGLEDLFWLAHMGSGESGRVVLRIGLNGEAQVNSYQDTLARLRISFAVEDTGNKPGDPGYGGSASTVSTTGNSGPGTIAAVQTGDDAHPVLWLCLAGASLVCIMVLLAARRRAGREEQ